jgi:hypothetical protein
VREASYNSIFASKIERQIGGRVIKISDKVSLGLPDSVHLMSGIATFFEVKIGIKRNFCVKNDISYCYPWTCINDLRQYEVCRSIGKNATVLYIIYWPDIRMTTVLSVGSLAMFRPVTQSDSPNGLQLIEGDNFVKGHGVEVFHQILEKRKREIYGYLAKDYSTISNGVS